MPSLGLVKEDREEHSLVPRPRSQSEKWPGIHCLRMRKRFRKFSANRSEYGQVTHGCYAEK